MAAVIIFSIMIVYVLIRTIAYGVYSVRKTGAVGGVSVFFLALCAVVVLYITLSGNKGIG